MSSIFIGDMPTEECYAFESAAVAYADECEVEFMNESGRPFPTVMWFDALVKFRDGAEFAKHCADKGIALTQSGVQS